MRPSTKILARTQVVPIKHGMSINTFRTLSKSVKKSNISKLRVAYGVLGIRGRCRVIIAPILEALGVFYPVLAVLHCLLIMPMMFHHISKNEREK